MKRGDVVVFSISAGLAAVVVAAVAFSVLVIDREPRSPANEPGNSTASLLVVTWGPSLCKVDPANPGCTSGHVVNLGSTIIMHGLWPQPPSEQYCGVSGEIADEVRDARSGSVPPPDLPESVRAELRSMMSDATVMAPHEWYAHGTCSGVEPAVYFGDAIALTEQASKILNPVFKDAQNGHLSLSTVRSRFEAEFGKDAGKRVGLTCRDVDGEGIVVYEVHLSLPAVVQLRHATDTPSLADLLTEGPTIVPECRRGRVP